VGAPNIGGRHPPNLGWDPKTRGRDPQN